MKGLDSLWRFSARRAPGPPSGGLYGHLSDFHRDPLGTVVEGYRAYGDVVRFRFGTKPGFLLARPKHIRHVLIDRATDFDRSFRAYEILQELLGEGLLTSQGASWQRQKQEAQVAFEAGTLKALVPTIVRFALETASSWSGVAARERSVEVLRDLRTLTLRVAGELLLGFDLRDKATGIDLSLEAYLKSFHEHMYSPLRFPLWGSSHRRLSSSRAKKELDQSILQIIKQRRLEPGRGRDLLTKMLTSDDDRAIDDRTLRDALINLLIPAHFTTASALAFTFYLLARHPQAAHRARREAEAAFGRELPSADSLPKLRYTKRVIDEAMRLFPPVWLIVRRARKSQQIDGYDVPRGSIVMLSPFITHRHPELWQNSERFDPDRFVRSDKSRLAFYPFGAGPRSCIGTGLAQIEMRLVVALTIQRFELSCPGSRPIPLDARSSLSPRKGLRLMLREI